MEEELPLPVPVEEDDAVEEELTLAVPVEDGDAVEVAVELPVSDSELDRHLETEGDKVVERPALTV